MMTSSAFYEVRIPDFEIPAARLFLTAWLSSSGTHVESDDPLCEICAGDIVIEIMAKRNGVFYHAAVDVDDELVTGTLIGKIELESQFKR